MWVGERDDDLFVGGEEVYELFQAAVVEDAAVMDDDHTWAECFHIGHVVAGKQDRRFVALVVLLNKVAGAAANEAGDGRFESPFALGDDVGFL